MELAKDKPSLPYTKSQKRLLRKTKWENAEETKAYFNSIGISAEIFLKSTATPHMRIFGCVDYWPATSRFYDHELKEWGVGFEPLKIHICQKQSLNEAVYDEMTMAMQRDGE